MTFPTSNDVDTVLTSRSRYLHDVCAEGAPQSVLVLTPFVLYDIEFGHDLYNDHIDVAYAPLRLFSKARFDRSGRVILKKRSGVFVSDSSVHINDLIQWGMLP